MSERYSHLLDPRALKGPRVLGLLLAPGGGIVAETLDRRAAQIAAQSVNETSATVLIQGRQIPDARGRTRRIDPNKLVDGVIATAENIRAQKYSGHVAIAATVDVLHFAPTAAQTESLARLRVSALREAPTTNASAAVNSAVRQMGVAEGVAVVMAAGNKFATDQALRAAALHVGEGASGAYGPLVRGRNPSRIARAVLSGSSEYYQQEADPDNNPWKSSNGYMSDAGAAFSGRSLRDNPLDEGYGRGGGAREWGAHLQRRPGDIWYEPALAVHDSRAYYLDLNDMFEEASREEPTQYFPPRS